LDSNGILSYEIKYFGAHTGRFSGSGGFNIQNMPREPLKGVHLRNMILPRPGKKIVHIDLSQIEARILLWFAGDKEALTRIGNGEHIYEVHARETMGWTGGPLKKENPKLYSLAKARVLGAGYQCGGPRFVSLAKTMAGVLLTEAEAVKTRADYRAKNKKIVAFWGRLNRDFFWSYQKNEPYEMCLPSGRVLRYENIKSIGGNLRASVEINGNPHNFFGGKLTENLVQATARDVFVEAMMRASAKFPMLFHVHDEGNFEVDATTAEYDATEIKRLFEMPVPWLPGCPIEAEVKVLDRYEK
jgi:DNA polymerase